MLEFIKRIWTGITFISKIEVPVYFYKEDVSALRHYNSDMVFTSKPIRFINGLGEHRVGYFYFEWCYIGLTLVPDQKKKSRIIYPNKNKLIRLITDFEVQRDWNKTEIFKRNILKEYMYIILPHKTI